MGWHRGQAYGQDLRDRQLACSDLTLVQVADAFWCKPVLCVEGPAGRAPVDRDRPFDDAARHAGSGTKRSVRFRPDPAV